MGPSWLLTYCRYAQALIEMAVVQQKVYLRPVLAKPKNLFINVIMQIQLSQLDIQQFQCYILDLQSFFIMPSFALFVFFKFLQQQFYLMESGFNDTKAQKQGVYEFVEEYLPQVKEMMASSFLQNNQFWRSYHPKREDLLNFFQKILRQHFQAQRETKQKFGQKISLGSVPNQQSQIYIYKGVVQSCLIHYQLGEYVKIQKQKRPQSLQIFKDLQQNGKKLIKAVDTSSYHPGTAVYGNFWGALVNSDVNKLKRFVILIQFYQRIKKSGFRWMIGRYSNVRALKLYLKIGAKLLNTVPFQRKGKIMNLYFAQLDLYGDAFEKSQELARKFVQLQSWYSRLPKL